jgi:hypothetical protein
MADLSITNSSVAPATNATNNTGTAGATIVQGKAVYISGTQVLLAQSNAGGTASVYGIALNSAYPGQPIEVQIGGTCTIGATVVVGQTYVLSAANAGGIAPITDLATGNYVSIIGIGTSTTTIQINLQNSGVTHP